VEGRKRQASAAVTAAMSATAANRYDGGWDGPRDRKMKALTADGCEIERKWKKGEYEEKVKCKPGRYGYRY
jgi:hypothetical protein